MTKNITFTLPAVALEGASEAYLLGDFNHWNPDNAPKLEKQKDGSYQTKVELEEGKTYEYRFLLNDGRWVNDYNAQSYTQVEGLYVDNCVITVPASDKKETKKAQPAKKEATAPKKEKAKVAKKAPATAKPVTPGASKTATVKPAKKTAPKTTELKEGKAVKAEGKKTTAKAAPKAKK